VDDALNKHRDFVEWAEGRRAFPYEDSVGKLTVGVGRNLDDRGLSDDEIDLLLSNDQLIAYKEATGLPFFEGLDTVRQMVVVDMIFNMGFPRFSGFVKTIEHLFEGDYTRAALEMRDSKWYRQTGRRAKALVVAMHTGKLHYGAG
jgi:lysozyme